MFYFYANNRCLSLTHLHWNWEKTFAKFSSECNNKKSDQNIWIYLYTVNMIKKQFTVTATNQLICKLIQHKKNYLICTQLETSGGSLFIWIQTIDFMWLHVAFESITS